MIELRNAVLPNHQYSEEKTESTSEDLLFNFLQSISLPTVQIIRIRLKQ